MTENQLRRSFCDAARSWLGAREADGSHRPIIDRYNAIRPLPDGVALGYGDPWCAAFVSAVGEQCSLGRIVFPHCNCQRMIALYKAAGRWEEQDFAVPRPGDLIFYDWDDDGAGDCTGTADHVGIVTAVDGEVLTVVEGNRSDAVSERKLHVDARFIRGYGQPDYASLAEDAAASSPSAGHCEESGSPLPGADAGGPVSPQPPDSRAEASKPGTEIGYAARRAKGGAEGTGGSSSPSPSSQIEISTLSRGDTGETVRAAQLLLIGRGCRCGPWGADGDFGPATQGAVQSYQRGHRLTVDGVVGPATWRALLGLSTTGGTQL